MNELDKINNQIANNIVNDVPIIYTTIKCQNKIELMFDDNYNNYYEKFVNIDKYFHVKKRIVNFYKPTILL